jgi:hypothetical protein
MLDSTLIIYAAMSEVLSKHYFVCVSVFLSVCLSVSVLYDINI